MLKAGDRTKREMLVKGHKVSVCELNPFHVQHDNCSLILYGNLRFTETEMSYHTCAHTYSETVTS